MGFDPITVALVAASVYAGSEMGKAGSRIKPPPPSPTVGPTPTTVMAGERAEKDRLLKEKRRALTVMGGDYGALNVQTNKLGT